MLPDTVLLVDDEPIVLDVLTQALKKKGLTVKTATKLADAVELLRKETFGCLLVDKNLPDGDGVQLIRLCREVQPYCACMVMTGYPNVSSIIEALRLGAVDYLEKPFPQLSIVQEKVKAALERQKLVAERELLHQRIKQLQSSRPDEFRDSTELVMLQQALEVAKEDAERALAELRASSRKEVEELNDRLETMKARFGKVLTAIRRATLQVNALVENPPSPHAQPVDAELRDVRRLLTSVIDEP